MPTTADFSAQSQFMAWDTSGVRPIAYAEFIEIMGAQIAQTQSDPRITREDGEALSVLIEDLLAAAGPGVTSCICSFREILTQARDSKCGWPLRCTNPDERSDQVRLGAQLRRLRGVVVTLRERRGTLHRLSSDRSTGNRSLGNQWIVVTDADKSWQAFLDGVTLFRAPVAKE